VNRQKPLLQIGMTSHFKPEKKYIAEVLFNRFLGFEIKFTESDFTGYYSIFFEGKTLLIKDCFWSALSPHETYLQSSKLPQTVKEYHHENIVALYYENGDITSNITINGKNLICCNADLLASAFFCLSRWEEYLPNDLDQYGRFNSKDSIIVKNDLIHRPLVNEYCFYLKKLLAEQLNLQARKKWEFKQYLTHDIDHPVRWQNSFSFIKTATADIIKRKNVKLLYENTRAYLKGVNHFDQIDYFMSLAEESGSASVFYFLLNQKNTKSLTKNSSNWPLKLQKTEIGIHPDLNTFDIQNLSIQKQRLEKWTGRKIEASRQHYLQWKWPLHLNLLEKAKITSDSSLYFADQPGFRTSCCWEFPLFDVTQRRETKVIERNLIFMDVSLMKSSKDLKLLWEDIFRLKKTCQENKGDFVILWHNSSLYSPFWQSQKQLFEKLIFN